MEEVNCLLCDSAERQVLCLKGRHKENVKTVICKNCSLVYTSPRMDEEELKNYYKFKYSEKYFRKEDIENINRKNDNRYMFLKENINLKEGMKILEIGCGKGFFLKYLKDKNFYVEGVEPNLEYYNFAINNFGLKVFNGYIENYDFKDSKFDIVIMFHLLEHISNPLYLLGILKLHLQENGVLFIEVPDILRNPGYDVKENFFRKVHFYNFTYFTLSLLLNKGSFKIISKDPTYGNIRVLAKQDESINFVLPEKKVISKYIRKVKRHLFLWNFIVYYNKFLYSLRKKARRILKYG